MNLEVELRPHTGTQLVPGLGEVVVEFDQYMIYITGADYEKATGLKELHAGYVAKQAVYVCPRTGLKFDTPINWLPVVNQWPPAVIEALSKSVQNALAQLASAQQADKDLVASSSTRPVNVPPDLSSVDVSTSVVNKTSDAASQASAENL